MSSLLFKLTLGAASICCSDLVNQGLSIAQTPPQAARPAITTISGKAIFGIQDRTVGTWGGYTSSNLLNGSGNVSTTNWMLFAKFPDLFQAGNLGGIYLGQPPKITDSNLISNGIGEGNIPSYLTGSGGRDPGGQTGSTTHLELFYQIQMASNLWVTPGVIVIFNPLHNAQNSSITIGTLRTTFNF